MTHGFVPLNDPVRQIAYSVTSEAVTTVIADGKFLMKDRKIKVFDEDTMLGEIIERPSVTVARCCRIAPPRHCD